MTITVLFWNFNPNKGDSRTRLPSEAEHAAIAAGLASEHQVDILVLAECPIPGEVIRETLLQTDPRWESPAVQHRRFRFFTRFPGDRLEPFKDHGRMAVRRLNFEGHQDILLAALHYLDRRNNNPDEQYRDVADFRQTLLEAERDARHRRTILFGDFNMNPFDKGMLDSAYGLGAMMTRDLARVREDDDRERPRRTFYNPMWSLMGGAESPGTFYWGKDAPRNPFWKCYDQVLVRPSLLTAFRDEDVRIIGKVNGVDGTRMDLSRLAVLHWKLAYSDHLPLLFKVALPPIVAEN